MHNNMNPEQKPSLESIFGSTLGNAGTQSGVPTLAEIFSGAVTEEDLPSRPREDRTQDFTQGGENIQQTFKEAAQDVQEAKLDPNQSKARGVVQSFGITAGAVADALGTGLTTMVKAGLSQETENKIKTKIGNTIQKLSQTPGGQDIKILSQSFQDFYENELTPAQQRDVDAVGGVVKLVTELEGVGKVSKATSAGLDVAQEGIEAAGKGIKNVGKKTAILTGEATGSASNLIGTGLEKVGQKIQQTVIKPSVKDVKDGFKIENVSKYDVGGSLPETIAKTHTKMNQLSQELKSKLVSTDAKLDLKKVYQDTLKSLGGDKAMSFGDNSAIGRVIKNLKSEIGQVSKSGKVDLVKATNVKRGAGSKGAWAYNRPEADASAIERVYTAFYNKLKTEIEKVAPDGVKDINKQISELIPINNAALRRMTVEERNNALSLMDNIGLVSAIFDPRALILFGTNKALKSGKVGQLLTKAGQKLKKVKDISPTK